MKYGDNKFQHAQNPFSSFWMAGFECTDKLNAFGNRVDLLRISGHLDLLEEDYQRLDLFGMRTVREGIRWSKVEKTPYHYNWSDVEKIIRAGKRNHIQQVWDICHFGFPDDLTPLHPMFARRFASVCRSFVKFYRDINPEEVLVVTPINEVSFLSWLGGDARGTSPYCVGQGWEVKYHLMKAYIEGIEAMLEIDPTIRILTTEPMINIVCPRDSDDEMIKAAKRMHEDQFQVTDILSGRICPELRGKPEYLDILGYNYYFNNQWYFHNHEYLDWQRSPESNDCYRPLHSLLQEAYNRYGCPMVITETSHPKEDRPGWIEMISKECQATLIKGLPLWGICWYPVIDRPDWDFPDIWHQSGLWDGAYIPGQNTRLLHEPSARALLEAQQFLKCLVPSSKGEMELNKFQLLEAYN